MRALGLEYNMTLIIRPQACKSNPNAPPTDPKAQFPPCLPSGASNPSFSPCAADRKCQRVDNTCEDYRYRAQGGCIGICIPRTIGQTPKFPYFSKGAGGGGGAAQPASQSNPWQNAQPQQAQPVPQLQPQIQPQGGPPSFGSCPNNVRCPGNNVCTPDPRNKNTFLCINAGETCGGFQNIGCPGGKQCIADPRIQW